MDNQFKHRITRIFRSSFESCRSKNITDVIESAVHHHPTATTENHHQLIHLFSPKKHTPPCSSCNCKPKLPESLNIHNSCIIRKKSCLFSDNNREKLQLQLLDGHKCPPASPVTPFNFHNQNPPNPLSEDRVKKRNSKRGNRKRIGRSSRSISYGMNDFPACSYNGLFSSDDDDDDDNDEDDNTTFFSSRSLSSESSRSFRQGKGSGRSRRVVKEKRKEIEEEEEEEDSISISISSSSSYAVVKRTSNDPYNDFRTSMEEMIIEKQIFTPNDLEDLLQCFLSLNSLPHHRVILQVFNHIWNALFS